MKTFTVSKTLVAALGLAFGTCVLAAPMTKAEHKSAKDGIEADYKAMKAACGSMADNAKDICEATARGKRDVTLAELEARIRADRMVFNDGHFFNTDGQRIEIEPVLDA